MLPISSVKKHVKNYAYYHIFRTKQERNSYRAHRDYLSKRIKQIFEESNQICGAKKIKTVIYTSFCRVNTNPL